MDLHDPEQRAEIETKIQQAQEQDNQTYQQLRRNARAVYHAVEGWRSVDTPEAWQRVCEKSREEYQSGQFLIESLGAEQNPRHGCVFFSLGVRARALLYFSQGSNLRRRKER